MHTRILTHDDVSNVLTLGGTLLGTSRENPFKVKIAQGGKSTLVDKSDLAVENYKLLKLDALVTIGGDGTHRKAHKLWKKGLNIVGIPKTIDNDLAETDATIGFDSAVAIATESIDRLHSTAASHHRAMVIEVMGNRAGWLALASGIAGGGDVILIPEIPYDSDVVADVVKERNRRGRRCSIIVVAEGTRPASLKKSGKDEEWGGDTTGQVGMLVAQQIGEKSGLETRVTVLGHVQRGGSPTAFDRLLATRFGTRAVDLVAKEKFGRMVCLRENEVHSADMDVVASTVRTVPPDHSWVESARKVGTCFGDE
jgi:6-phosphofructokinase 1